MKDAYQHERNKAKTRELPDTFEREPLDFHTEKERDRIAAESERHRVAELERVRETRRQWLADKEAGKRAGKEALIKRHERWLSAWHIVLLIGGTLVLVKIVDALITNGL
jgi:hypothetical protein